MKKLRVSVLLLLSVLALTVAVYSEPPGRSDPVPWFSINAGGYIDTAKHWGVSIGQSVIGSCSTAQSRVGLGFWQRTEGCTHCGDADNNGFISITDAVALVNYVFNGTPIPEDCNYPQGMGDFDGNGFVSIADAVACINFIFLGSPCPHCMGLPCWVTSE